MMRRSPALGGVVLAIVAAAAACDSDGGISIRSAWESFRLIDCDKAHECRESYRDSQAAFEVMYGGSTEACARMALGARFDELVRADEEAVASGRLVYNAGNVQPCADAKRAQSCADYWAAAPIPVCYTVFTGHVGSGGACQWHTECASGTCDVSMTCL